jgi:tetratricopeptide (TPR) repeat protein
LAEAPAQAQSLSSAQLEQVLQRQANDPVALMRLGETYERDGAAEKSADAYERALKANSKLLAASMKLAQLNAGPLKNSAKALEYAKKARELAPSDPHVAVALGGIAYQTGNFQWAYSLLQDAARQLGDDPEALDRFAWAAYSLGRVAEAQQAMQRIVDSSPNSPQAPQARTFLAMVALDAEGKDPSASEAQVKQVLAGDPHFLPALVAQASIQQRRGDIKTAAAVYTDILQQFPDFAIAQKHLAAIDAENPNTLGKAAELAMKARKNLADDVELSCILGRISYKQKEYGRAIQLLHESERKKPLDPPSIFVLAMSQAQTGHKVEAREGLQRALDSGLGEPDATEAKRVLAELNRPVQ